MKLIILFVASVLLVAVCSPVSDCIKERERKKTWSGFRVVHPECDEKTGAYKIIQCMEHYGTCFCADPLTGRAVGSMGTQGITEKGELEAACFRNTTRCTRERYDFTQGEALQYPECQDSGHFAQEQCHNSTCVCVDEVSGRQIEGTQIHQAEQADDRCKNTECAAQNRVTNVPGKWMPRCDPDRGNFVPVQCRDSACFCVDRLTGEQVSEQVHIDEVKQLYNICMTDCERLRDKGIKPARSWQFTEHPRCEASGVYHNVQVKADQCSCVDSEGQPMRSAVEPMSQPISKLNQLERQCRGGITDCKNRRIAYRWTACPDECSFYSGGGEAIVNCCCD